MPIFASFNNVLSALSSALSPIRSTLDIIKQQAGGANAKSEVILRRMGEMSEALNRLTQEVGEIKTVGASVIALLQSLSAQIRENAANEAAINALADDLDTVTSDLASAVGANTAAEGETGDGTGKALGDESTETIGDHRDATGGTGDGSQRQTGESGTEDINKDQTGQ